MKKILKYSVFEAKSDSLLEEARRSEGIKKIRGLVKLDDGDYPLSGDTSEVIFFVEYDRDNESELSIHDNGDSFDLTFNTSSGREIIPPISSLTIESILKDFWISFLILRRDKGGYPNLFKKNELEKYLSEYYQEYNPEDGDEDDVFRKIYEKNLDYFTYFRSAFADDFSKKFFDSFGLKFSEDIEFYKNRSYITAEASKLILFLDKVIPSMGSSVKSALHSISTVAVPYSYKEGLAESKNIPHIKFKSKEELIEYIFDRINNIPSEGLKYTILSLVRKMYYEKKIPDQKLIAMELSSAINNEIHENPKNIEKYIELLFLKKSPYIVPDEETMEIGNSFLDDKAESDFDDLDWLIPYMEAGVYKPNVYVSSVYGVFMKGI